MPDVVSPKLRALETAETLTETVKGPRGEAFFDGVNSVPEYRIIIRRIYFFRITVFAIVRLYLDYFELVAARDSVIEKL